MRLKASTDYAVRALIYLGMKSDTCSSKDIAEEMGIPRDYLIQLALHLRNANILKARPGKNGGYTLARPASKITLGQVMEAFEGEGANRRHPLKATKKSPDTVHSAVAARRFVEGSFDEFFSKITLEQMLQAGEEAADSKAR